MRAFERAAALQDLWSGDMAARRVGGRKVLLVRFGDEVLAYEDRCPHLGVPLSEGTLAGPILTCRAHHWCYDARTGQGVNPRSACLRRLTVMLESGDVLVDIGEEAIPCQR